MPCIKNHKFGTVLTMLCCCIICYFVCALLSSCTNREAPQANDVPVFVNGDGFSYSNARQNRTTIKMQAIDGSLWIYMLNRDTWESSLYKFDNNGVSKLENVLITNRNRRSWSDSCAGFGDRHMYIKRHTDEYVQGPHPRNAELIYYDLVTDVSGTLIGTEVSGEMDTMLDENGYLYVSTKEMSSGDKKEYCVFQGDVLLTDKATEPDARTGWIPEVLQKYNDIAPMLSESQLNNAVAAATEYCGIATECVLYPCKDGWLLHMSGSAKPLWLVSSDGTISSVFDYECMASSSSFNLYGDTAFFSLVRYEKWDDRMGYFLQRYENDFISGTYRIDLADWTITKISEKDYCGIFVFDDTSIFVCDKKYGVYQLDYDGNLMTTLINPSG